ncbi:MAG: DUF2520 domain-containing protein [Bacteroidetes bacterium]|nr:MAG: DUF2520 domain-containing protein [Bacteroidota bacterium]TAG88209.1 MAG: DUF2520 domain-containing protein [Bacteroidota bacterium]
MKISFIGAGNVATQFALEFSKHTSMSIEEVYSQNIENAHILVKKIKQGKAINSLNLYNSNANIIIISIKDDALENVISLLKVNENAIVVHTSGSQPLEILGVLTQNIGVFYPLQTFSKEKQIDFSLLNICIEGKTSAIQNILSSLAEILKAKISFIDSNQRKYLHIAAVFSCNFANHLWALSDEYLREKHISFDLLKPLLEETLEKALLISPKKAQTGPAKRNDTKIIDKHIKLLEENPNMQKIYQTITESIINLNK